jgi:hypothetical protein
MSILTVAALCAAVQTSALRAEVIGVEGFLPLHTLAGVNATFKSAFEAILSPPQWVVTVRRGETTTRFIVTGPLGVRIGDQVPLESPSSACKSSAG